MAVHVHADAVVVVAAARVEPVGDREAVVELVAVVVLPGREEVAARVVLHGRIHRAESDFGSTLPVSNRDAQSNCWVK